jgi:cation-transporting ATPase 13A3/4/5
VTIAIPPALPAAMTVGRLCAQTRLQEKSIFCINSHVINVAGSIDCVCFDKVRILIEFLLLFLFCRAYTMYFNKKLRAKLNSIYR